MELKLWLDHYITRKSWSNPLLSSPCTAQASPGSFVPITGRLDPSRLSTLAVFLRQCLCHYNRSPFFLEASPLQGSGHPPSLSLTGLQRLTHFRHQFIAALPELPFHITNLSYFLSFLRQRASRLKKMLSFSLYVFELWSIMLLGALKGLVPFFCSSSHEVISETLSSLQKEESCFSFLC